MASPHVSFIPVEDPISQLCTDDTLSRTEWFNVPVVRFSGTAIVLFGRTTTTHDLQEWAKDYYEHKVERGLWVQIAPGDVENAERALLPLVRMFPIYNCVRLISDFLAPRSTDSQSRLFPRTSGFRANDRQPGRNVSPVTPTSG